MYNFGVNHTCCIFRFKRVQGFCSLANSCNHGTDSPALLQLLSPTRCDNNGDDELCGGGGGGGGGGGDGSGDHSDSEYISAEVIPDQINHLKVI